jgi:hypothetical protein
MFKFLIMMAVGFFSAASSADETVTEVAPDVPVADTHVVAAEDETSPGSEVAVSARLPVAVVSFGDVDDAIAQRAQQWAELNLAIPVPLLRTEPGVQLATFEEVTAAAVNIMETNRLGLVVLWRPSSDINNHGAHYPDKRVAVVNLNPMLTVDTDAEKIERRIERQVIRGVCMLMGLEPSPNPFSAMFNYSNLEELDAIGRNLDPPWLKRLQLKALEYGIPVDQESVFNMIN